MRRDKKNILVLLAMSHLVVSSQTQVEELLNDFTYAALLHVRCMNQTPRPLTVWRCGSCVVNQFLILTAAQCVEPAICDEISMSVTVGYSDKVKALNTSVRSYIIHEDYAPKFQADLALVRLVSSLEFNEQVSRVALMTDPPYADTAEIVGWEQRFPTTENLANDFNYSSHYVLMKEDCTGVIDDLPNGTFCGASKNSDYVLNVDPGTALVIHGYIQLGIYILTKSRDKNTVFIFTDVRYFYDWIQDTAATIMFENIDKENWQDMVFRDKNVVNKSEVNI